MRPDEQHRASPTFLRSRRRRSRKLTCLCVWTWRMAASPPGPIMTPSTPQRQPFLTIRPHSRHLSTGRRSLRSRPLLRAAGSLALAPRRPLPAPRASLGTRRPPCISVGRGASTFSPATIWSPPERDCRLPAVTGRTALRRVGAGGGYGRAASSPATIDSASAAAPRRPPGPARAPSGGGPRPGRRPARGASGGGASSGTWPSRGCGAGRCRRAWRPTRRAPRPARRRRSTPPPTTAVRTSAPRCTVDAVAERRQRRRPRLADPVHRPADVVVPQRVAAGDHAGRPRPSRRGRRAPLPRRCAGGPPRCPAPRPPGGRRHRHAAPSRGPAPARTASATQTSRSPGAGGGAQGVERGGIAGVLLDDPVQLARARYGFHASGTRATDTVTQASSRRRVRGAGEIHPRLDRCAVALAQVARPAGRGDVLPLVTAAARPRHDVVDRVGELTAVLADVIVAGEHRPARQRGAPVVRHLDHVAQADDQRVGHARSTRRAARCRRPRRCRPCRPARGTRPDATARPRAARTLRSAPARSSWADPTDPSGTRRVQFIRRVRASASGVVLGPGTTPGS